MKDRPQFRLQFRLPVPCVFMSAKLFHFLLSIWSCISYHFPLGIVGPITIMGRIKIFFLWTLYYNARELEKPVHWSGALRFRILELSGCLKPHSPLPCSNNPHSHGTREMNIKMISRQNTSGNTRTVEAISTASRSQTRFFQKKVISMNFHDFLFFYRRENQRGYPWRLYMPKRRPREVFFTASGTKIRCPNGMGTA